MRYVLVMTLSVFVGIGAFSSAFGGSVSAVFEDTPLKVTKKPQPNARGCSGKGRMQVKVTFDQSGQITDAAAVSVSGCASFDESAVEAAKRIEFEPAKKDGVPVTTVKIVEYVYKIY